MDALRDVRSDGRRPFLQLLRCQRVVTRRLLRHHVRHSPRLLRNDQDKC